MKILDVCCGSKMFWYDKQEPNTIFMDNRCEKDEVKDREYIRIILVNPDIVASDAIPDTFLYSSQKKTSFSS